MGALGASVADYGIGSEFLEKIRSQVTGGASEIFLLVGHVTTDKVVKAFKTAPEFEVFYLQYSDSGTRRTKTQKRDCPLVSESNRQANLVC